MRTGGGSAFIAGLRSVHSGCCSGPGPRTGALGWVCVCGTSTRQGLVHGGQGAGLRETTLRWTKTTGKEAQRRAARHELDGADEMAGDAVEMARSTLMPAMVLGVDVEDELEREPWNSWSRTTARGGASVLLLEQEVQGDRGGVVGHGREAQRLDLPSLSSADQ